MIGGVGTDEKRLIDTVLLALDSIVDLRLIDMVNVRDIASVDHIT